MIDNMQVLSVGTGFLACLTLFYVVTASRYRQRYSALQEDLEACKHQQAQQEGQHIVLQEQYDALHQQAAKHQQHIVHLNTQLREAETRLELERIHFQQRLEEQQQAKVTQEQQLLERFENFSQKLLDQHGNKFRSLNQDNLQRTLAPFFADLKHFRHSFQENHRQESQERQQLKFELERLAKLNQQMTEDATALTQALKGDSKTQGSWGELVLDRVLSASGLREGHEYASQPTFKDDKGQSFRPDVVVYLPHKRCVIIDAKVSLTAYERYCRTQEREEQEQYIGEHTRSLKQHIQSLASKNYQHLEQLKSLDYILMFIPVEPAFALAIARDAELVELALKHNILLVSPANLFVALRTIDHLWKSERKNKNTEEIAKRACNLYDKFRLLAEELESLGGLLERTRESHHTIMKRIVSGRDNIVKQVEHFRVLGVPVKRPLPELLKEQAQVDEVEQVEFSYETQHKVDEGTAQSGTPQTKSRSKPA